MTVRQDWLTQVTRTSQDSVKLVSNKIEFRLTENGTVFLRPLKDQGDSFPWKSREHLLQTINDAFDTLEEAQRGPAARR